MKSTSTKAKTIEKRIDKGKKQRERFSKERRETRRKENKARRFTAVMEREALVFMVW